MNICQAPSYNCSIEAPKPHSIYSGAYIRVEGLGNLTAPRFPEPRTGWGPPWHIPSRWEGHPASRAPFTGNLRCCLNNYLNYFGGVPFYGYSIIYHATFRGPAAQPIESVRHALGPREDTGQVASDIRRVMLGTSLVQHATSTRHDAM